MTRALSVYGVTQLGSLLDFCHLGSTMSVRHFDVLTLGSSLSLRNFIRVASSMSVFRTTKVGWAISTLDRLHVGSFLSVRSFSRLSNSLSVFGISRLGSVASILDQVILAHLCRVFDRDAS
eukprot:g17459.t1